MINEIILKRKKMFGFFFYQYYVILYLKSYFDFFIYFRMLLQSKWKRLFDLKMFKFNLIILGKENRFLDNNGICIRRVYEVI